MWIPRQTVPACVLALLSSTAYAISSRDAGLHDWHLALIGQPSISPGTSPRFHYPAGPSQSAVSALVYTATQRNVLAAIEPRAGEIVWRHIFPDNKPVLRYTLHGDYLLALSGPAASDLHLFSASTGHVIWSIQQHAPEHGLLPEPGSIAADAVFLPSSGAEAGTSFDVISMNNGEVISRIDGQTGEIIWTRAFVREQEPTMQIHAIVPPAPGSDYIHFLLIKRTTGSYSLQTLTLSSAGQPSESSPKAIRGTSLASLDSTLIFPPIPGTLESRAIYLEGSGELRSVLFFDDSERDPKVSALKSKRYKKLVSLGLEEHGVFVGLKQDGAASVLQVGNDGQIQVLHEWTDAAAEARYSGSVDRTGIAHVSRFTISKVLGLASMTTYTVHATSHSEAGTIFSTTFPYSPTQHGQMLHVTSEIAPRKSAAFTFRWSREEGLAHLSLSSQSPSLAFLPVSASKAVATFSIGTSLSPSVLFGALSRPFLGSLRSIGLLSPSNDVSTAVARDWLSDAFGYRKLVIAATEFGKMYALDLGNGGKILWTTFLLPLQPTSTDRSYPKKMVWKKVAIFDKREDGRVLIMAVAQVETVGNELLTQVFYLDGMTGALFHKGISSALAVKGPVENVFVLHGSSDPTLVLVDKDNLVYLSTPPEGIVSSSRVGHSTPHLNLVDFSETHSLKASHAVLSSGANPMQAEPSWTFAIPANERVVSVARQTNGKIASVGRVLGDRSTLYKYINPHLLAIATVDDARHSGSIYLIDSITGGLLWSAVHDGEIDPAAGLPVTLTENWLVYAFAGRGSDGHQTRLASVELFEDIKKDSAIRTTFSSYTKSKPYDVSRAFVYPGRIASLSTSQTLHGISTKALLVSTMAEQIISIPRRYLDPRRPMHKPTKKDMEEYLIPYDPVLPIDPKWIITHKNRVAGVKGVITSPTVLESTSQILAYGLDLFGSSVSPSGRFDVLSKDFNKLQLVATTLALLGAIGVLKPMVQKKQLRERWYPAS